MAANGLFIGNGETTTALISRELEAPKHSDVAIAYAKTGIHAVVFEAC